MIRMKVVWSLLKKNPITNSLESTKIDSNHKTYAIQHPMTLWDSMLPSRWDFGTWKCPTLSQEVIQDCKITQKHATKLDVRTSRSKWSLACSSPCSLKTLETLNVNETILRKFAQMSAIKTNQHLIQLEATFTWWIPNHNPWATSRSHESSSPLSADLLFILDEISMNARNIKKQKQGRKKRKKNINSINSAIYRCNVNWSMAALSDVSDASAPQVHHPYRRNSKNDHSDTTLTQSRGHSHVHESWFSMWLDQSQIHDCSCLARARDLFKVFSHANYHYLLITPGLYV